MYVVISYDISDDRRRRKVAKLLEDYGTRVQYSVFDCLLHEKELSELRTQLQDIIKFEEDSIRFYRLCQRCQPAIEAMGLGSALYEEPFRIL